MQALMAQCMNVSECPDSLLPLGPAHTEKYAAAFASVSELPPVIASRTWAFQLIAISLISVVWLSTQIQARWASKSPSAPSDCKDPPQVPYLLPVLGHAISYMLNPFGLASFVKQRFGASSVVRLTFVSKDIYLVSGAEYLNAVWKNTKGLTIRHGINISLSHMFATPKEDMKVYESDDSGICHDPHPQSSVKPEDRVFHLVHKAVADNLSGPGLKISAQRFKDALVQHIEASPITEEWVEMDDLFGFVRPFISRSTIQAMCGDDFFRMYPEFFDDFWYFNVSMPKLLHRYPRWMVPKAWQARDRCIAVMKKWRKEVEGTDDFQGNGMISQRWAFFSKIQGLSDDGVAASDVGILWGMNTNSTPAAFWLIWHMLRDQSLLARASREVDACRSSNPSGPMDFDMARLIEQPLLQSCYAETLRKYTAVFMIRQPEREDAQVLDYRVPQGKMMVINSAMAHTDRRNWNTGINDEHPVESFWSDRFLTYGPKPRWGNAEASSTVSNGIDANEPRFSLKGYSGAWIPFGGGIHQCPGRHWVKSQMLYSFAAINAAFEIELVHSNETLRLDTQKYGLGVMQPGEKFRFRVRRRKAVV